MNRFIAALHVFMGDVEPLIEVRYEPQYVIGDASLVKLYRVAVQVPEQKGKKPALVRDQFDADTFEIIHPFEYGYARRVGKGSGHDYRYYTSCADANARHPNASVKQLDAVKVGDKYLPLDSLKLVEAWAPVKAKVAKGKR